MIHASLQYFDKIVSYSKHNLIFSFIPFVCRMIGAKIIKSGGAEPNEFEKSIGQALLELEINSDLKQQLRELYITRAKEVEYGTKKVILMKLIYYLRIN